MPLKDIKTKIETKVKTAPKKKSTLPAKKDIESVGIKKITSKFTATPKSTKPDPKSSPKTTKPKPKISSKSTGLSPSNSLQPSKSKAIDKKTSSSKPKIFKTPAIVKENQHYSVATEAMDFFCNIISDLFREELSTSESTTLEDYLPVIESIPVISSKTFQKIVEQSKTTNYENGELILKKGQSLDTLNLLVQGKTKIFDPDKKVKKEDKRIIKITGGGFGNTDSDFFNVTIGESALFNNNHYLYNYESIGSSRVITIPRHLIMDSFILPSKPSQKQIGNLKESLTIFTSDQHLMLTTTRLANLFIKTSKGKTDEGKLSLLKLARGEYIHFASQDFYRALTILEELGLIRLNQANTKYEALSLPAIKNFLKECAQTPLVLS